MSNPELPIKFTDAAATKVLSLITEEENPALKLRVYVTEGDMTIEKQGVAMVIDPMSLQYLVDGEVDYLESLEGSRFVVNNPNATTTCGCGSSFSM